MQGPLSMGYSNTPFLRAFKGRFPFPSPVTVSPDSRAAVTGPGLPNATLKVCSFVLELNIRTARIKVYKGLMKLRTFPEERQELKEIRRSLKKNRNLQESTRLNKNTQRIASFHQEITLPHEESLNSNLQTSARPR
jgi:hypothetical protein